MALAADVVVLLHAGFALFVGLGGALVYRWRKLAWVHVPAAVWGAAVELGGWICPLTPLERWLRTRAGAPAYTGDFIDHYVLPLLYPGNLGRTGQVVLGALVIGINGVVYWSIFRKGGRRPWHEAGKARR